MSFWAVNSRIFYPLKRFSIKPDHKQNIRSGEVGNHVAREIVYSCRRSHSATKHNDICHDQPADEALDFSEAGVLAGRPQAESDCRKVLTQVNWLSPSEVRRDYMRT
jgi:hypothetical protein